MKIISRWERTLRESVRAHQELEKMQWKLKEAPPKLVEEVSRGLILHAAKCFYQEIKEKKNTEVDKKHGTILDIQA